MIKCKICVHHQQQGNVHTCDKCENKTIYGEVIEQFIETCVFFEITEKEKKYSSVLKKMRIYKNGRI